MPRGIAEYRTFGGKKYEFRGGYPFKSDAQRRAKSIRKAEGIPARAVLIPKGIAAELHPATKWLVYARWTMPVKRAKG